MRIKKVIERIIDQCPSLKSVEPAVSLSPLQKDETDLPLVYVHVGKGQSSIDPNDEHPQNRETEHFVVLIVAKKLDMDTGVDQLEDVRDEVRAALFNYEIHDAEHNIDYEPIETVENDIWSLQGKIIWWRDVYRTRRYIR